MKEVFDDVLCVDVGVGGVLLDELAAGLYVNAEVGRALAQLGYKRHKTKTCQKYYLERRIENHCADQHC